MNALSVRRLVCLIGKLHRQDSTVGIGALKAHKYEYTFDTDSNTAAAAVVRFVGHAKRVLDLGAGPGSITGVLATQSGCRITALELDLAAIEKLEPICERVYHCDLNDPSWTSTLELEDDFEVLVAADVLEHLLDPWGTLRAMKELLEPDGYVVVSLPHVGHNAVLACILCEDFDYQDYGLLDKTHLRFFGLKNIQDLFESAGFSIVDAEFVVMPPEETELAVRWKHLPKSSKEFLAFNAFGSVYQVVVKAKLGRTGGIDLLALPVPDIASPARLRGLARSVVHRAKLLLRPYVPQRVRIRIRRTLHRLGVRI